MVKSQPQKNASSDTLANRTLVTLILLPIGLAAVYFGGWIYGALIALILALAADEYVGLFKVSDFLASGWIVIGSTLLIAAGRLVYGVEISAGILSICLLAGMTYHLIAFERGRDQAGSDFAATVTAIIYIGWLGAYMISLRTLPDGMWWVLTALPAVWLADSGAYFVGVRFGRHKMTPRLSPKKSWEGYLAGIPFAIIGTAALVLLYQRLGAGPAVTPLRGAILGAVIGTFSILGDLGESMIKRQVGVKDSSHLLPGHGGVFDRIDSWLWAGVIGYYIIRLFFLD